MAGGINIIDGFNVNTYEPVDYRLVVPTIIARDAIVYKYNGLAVFVEANRSTYVWNTTTLNWDIPFSGAPDMLALINSSGNGITASIIQHGVDGITFLNTNTYITTLGTMSIHGATGVSVKAGNMLISGGFASGGLGAIGGDVYINGGAGPISGNLYIGYPMTSGSINIGTNTIPDAGFTLQVQPQSQFNSSVRFKGLDNEVLLNLRFNSSITGITSSAYIKSSNIFSTVATPDYTWYGDTTTGIYHPAANTFGISVNGSSALLATTTNTKMLFGGSTVSISATAVGIYILNAPQSYQSLVVDKIKVTVNDFYANIHQVGTNGIGDSGNAPYAPNGFGSGPGPWNYPSIASGLFTLTTSGSPVNVSGVASIGYVSWIRVGNVVSVSGQVGFTVTVANTDSSFTLTIPIKSYFGTNNFWQLNGGGKILNTAAGANIGGGDVACVQAPVTGIAAAQFNFRPTSTGSKTLIYHYQYVVATYIDSGGGPGPGPTPPPVACFIGETMITMGDGTMKPIAEILLGDIVLSWNSKTSEVEQDIVLEMISPYHDDIVSLEFSDGTINANTFDHPYYVKDKGLCSYSPELTKLKYGIDAKQLVSGDECYKYSNGELSIITFISSVERMGNVRTYNIKTLQNNRSYFANGILVDNESTENLLSIKQLPAIYEHIHI